MSMIDDFDSDSLHKASIVWSDIQQLARDALGEEEIIYPTGDKKPSPNNPSLEEIKSILFEFQAEGAIKKLTPISFGRRNSAYQWKIQIDFHYFNELEKKLKSLYLSKSQEVLEKEGLSFDSHSQIIEKQISDQAVKPTVYYTPAMGDIADHRMEEFYEDQIRLISKLLQICNERTESVVLLYPADIAESDPDKAGFDFLETLQILHDKYHVFSKFAKPLPKELSHSLIVKAQVDFSRLKARAESLHDEVETWNGKVYGIEQQKKYILGRLTDYIRKSPHDDNEPYEYSERILGTYTPVNERRPLGTSLLNPDPNRIDIKYQFMRTMRELEKDGYLEILDIDFDFDAKPEPTSASQDAHKWSLGERSLEFYSAKHCHVKLKPKHLDSSLVKENPELQWNGLRLNVNTGRGEYNNKMHVFKLSKPHFKVLRTLLEANGKPVTYDQFFIAVDETLKDDAKNGKNFIRQKIRDIRKYFGLNRRKSRENDIFYDTGEGFQLMQLS